MKPFLQLSCILMAGFSVARASDPLGWYTAYAGDSPFGDPIAACYASLDGWAADRGVNPDDYEPLASVDFSAKNNDYATSFSTVTCKFRNGLKRFTAHARYNCNSSSTAIAYCKPPDEPPTTACGGGADSNSPVNNSSSTFRGNPVDVRSGNKYEWVTDFVTGGVRPLALRRVYNSGYGLGSRLGAGWATNFDRTIHAPTSNALALRDHNNHSLHFKKISGIWVQRNLYGAPTRKNDSRKDLGWSIEEHSAGVYTVTDPSGTVEVYQLGGDGFHHAVTSTTIDGYQLTFAYQYVNGAYVNTSVTDSFGKAYHFSYQAGSNLLASVTTPNGEVISYATLMNAPSDSLEILDNLGETDADVRTGYFRQSTVLSEVGYPDGTAVYYEYEIPYKGRRAYWLLTGIKDERGVDYGTWAYHSEMFGNNRVKYSTHPNGVDYTSFGYWTMPNAFQVSVTNALGLTTDYTFATTPIDKGASGYANTSDGPQLLAAINGAPAPYCAATSRQAGYDSAGFVETRTDAEGVVTEYVNDDRGRVTQTTEAAGTAAARVTTYEWDATKPLVTRMITPTLDHAFTYDAEDRLQSHVITDLVAGGTRSWTYTWLAGGLLNTVDGPLPGTVDLVDYDYDSAGNIAQITDETGRTFSVLAVDGNGRPTQINDFDGVATTITYDLRGRPIQFVDAHDSATTTMVYDLTGNITSITWPDASALTFTYDDARRLTNVQNAVGDTLTYAYNQMSEVTGVTATNAGGGTDFTQDMVVDALRRVREIARGGALKQTNSYDLEDRLILALDPTSGADVFVWDPLDRLTSTIELGAGTTALTYRADDALTSVTDPTSLATAYTRNGFGDLLSVTSPDTGTTNYTVDAAGRPDSRTDARGQVTSFTYDAAGRPTGTSYTGYPSYDQSWTYDPAGWPTTLTHKGGSLTYGYDTRRNVTSATRTQGGQTYPLSMTYDVADKMTSLTYPSGRQISYAYDPAGRVSGLTMSAPSEPSTGVFTGLTYNSVGALTGGTFANGTSLSRTYDQAGLLQRQTVTGVQDLTYGYDGRDNITAITDGVNSARSQTFGYDALSRLTSASGAYGTYTYEYDAVGNRTRRVGTGLAVFDETLSYFAGSHRLSQVSYGSGTRSFTYYSSGQVLTDTVGGVTTNFTLDPEGRVEALHQGGSPIADYTYDGLGLRVEKTVPTSPTGDSGTLHFIYDVDGRLLAEHDGSTGAVLREYVYFGLMPVAMIVPDGAGGSDVYAIHADQVNMPQKLTDATGTVVHDRVTTPFGELVSGVGSGSSSLTLRFPGQRADGEAGLFQNWMRDYDPALGRYVQSDPIGLAGGINTYAYVGGNPVSYVDPRGEFGIIGGVFGGAADLGMQLLMNGGNINCVSWTQVGVSAAAGAVGGAWIGKAFDHSVKGLKWAKASKRWGAVSKRYRKAQNETENIPSRKWDAHHWLFRRNGNTGSSWRNHPLNLKPVSRYHHKRIHGRLGMESRYDPIRRWWYGVPDWAKIGQGSIGAGVAGDMADKDCQCKN